jgi:hypothetical protein
MGLSVAGMRLIAGVKLDGSIWSPNVGLTSRAERESESLERLNLFAKSGYR